VWLPHDFSALQLSGGAVLLGHLASLCFHAFENRNTVLLGKAQPQQLHVDHIDAVGGPRVGRDPPPDFSDNVSEKRGIPVRRNQ
jgi:hypothetical protein